MLRTVIAKIIICNSTIVNKTIITICSMYMYCLATSLATRTLEKAKNANICNFTPYAYVKIARTSHNCRQQIEQSNNLQGKNEVLVQKVITKFFIRKLINLYTWYGDKLYQKTYNDCNDCNQQYITNYSLDCDHCKCSGDHYNR